MHILYISVKQHSVQQNIWSCIDWLGCSRDQLLIFPQTTRRCYYFVQGGNAHGYLGKSG